MHIMLLKIPNFFLVNQILYLIFILFFRDSDFFYIRTNNEFYIAPVYNQMIGDNKSLIPFYVNKMHGLGTPEDLRSFLNTEERK